MVRRKTMREDFYTPTGYRNRSVQLMTEAMEDYLEMICRIERNNQAVRVSDLAEALHVRPSSCSRMVAKLSEQGYLKSIRYGTIMLTEQGRDKGKYLLWRHQVLLNFFEKLNHNRDELIEIEQIEHFLGEETVRNLEKLTHKL